MWGMGCCTWIGLAPFHIGSLALTERSSPALALCGATVPRLAGMAVAARLALIEPGVQAWGDVLIGWAAAGVFAANMAAWGAQTPRRVLSWLGVAHTGYMMCALGAFSRGGVEALLFYASAFALAAAGITDMPQPSPRIAQINPNSGARCPRMRDSSHTTGIMIKKP